MKKKWYAALTAMVLVAGFAACQEEVPPYLVIEDVDDEDEDIHGKVVMGVTAPAEVPAHVKIPNGIVGIVGFENCTSLISITIPKSVTIIGPEAFSGCTSLASVTIPNSVEEIVDGAFEGCTEIEVIYKGSFKDWCAVRYWDQELLKNAKRITLSDGTDLKKLTKIDASNLKGVKEIGGSAFSGCTSLVSVTISEGVTKIGEFAFEGCTSLANVTIPESVTVIDGFAFSACTSLKSMTIPRGMTRIDSGLFLGCRSLTSVVIPHSVTEIDVWAFDACNPNLKIQYDGTKAQWKNEIKKNSFGIGTFVVQCTDGEVVVK